MKIQSSSSEDVSSSGAPGVPPLLLDADALTWLSDASIRSMNDAGTVIVSRVSSSMISLRWVIWLTELCHREITTSSQSIMYFFVSLIHGTV